MAERIAARGSGITTLTAFLNARVTTRLMIARRKEKAAWGIVSQEDNVFTQPVARLRADQLHVLQRSPPSLLAVSRTGSRAAHSFSTLHFPSPVRGTNSPRDTANAIRLGTLTIDREPVSVFLDPMLGD